MSTKRLDGKVAVITGATAGIGQAVARKFAAEGADLVLTGRRRDRAEALAAELREAGAYVELVIGDIRSDELLDELAQTVRSSYGRIDSLVLNAGVIAYAPAVEIRPQDFDEMMAVNVRAPWMCVRVLNDLLADGATIIALGSVSSFMVFPGESVYCMTKAAVIQLVRALAVEFADRKIRVNALCPGVIGEGGMSQVAIDASDDPAVEIANATASTPLGRLGSLDEIAIGAVFLASDESSFMSGTNLVLDGGLMVPRI